MAERLRAPDTAILAYNLRRLLGANMRLPENMFVFDLETTALQPTQGVIWQFGYYATSDGKVSGNPSGNAIYLKHPADVIRGAKYEIGRRRAVALGVEPTRDEIMVKDAAYKQAEDEFIAEIESKGQEPSDVIKTVLDTIKTVHENGAVLVAHNGCAFDIPWLIYNAKRYGLAYEWPDEQLLDTGMQIKTAIIGKRILPTQTYRQFYTKIGETFAKGAYFALERFCEPFFKLKEVYGIDMSKAHDAGFDAVVTNLVARELVDLVKNWDSSDE